MASSKRSRVQANSSAATSRARAETSTSSRTRSTSSISTVVIALGSNLGDRRYHLRRAVDALREVVHVVRVSSVHETEPVDAPGGMYLNMVVVGYTRLAPSDVLDALLALEAKLGRVRTGRRNEPRVIDLDLIAHSAHRVRTRALTLPHPRAHTRAFVMLPLVECGGAAAAFVRGGDASAL